MYVCMYECVCVCVYVCMYSSFKIIDTAKSYHYLKIKEAMHIVWEKPNINKQIQHYNISLTLALSTIFVFFIIRIFLQYHIIILQRSLVHSIETI